MQYQSLFSGETNNKKQYHHIRQISGDSLHEISKHIFWEKIRKKIFQTVEFPSMRSGNDIKGKRHLFPKSSFPL